MNCSASEVGRLLQGLTDAESLRSSVDVEKVVPETGDNELQLVTTKLETSSIEQSVCNKIPSRRLRQLKATFSAFASVM